MSLVLCILTKEAIYLISDGLVTDSENKHLEENRQKVFLMSNHTVFGYTGHLNSCISLKNSIVINKIYELPTKEFVDRSIEEAQKIIIPNNKCIQAIIVGNDNNNLQLYGFASHNFYKPYKFDNFDLIKAPICTSMTSDYVPDNECNALLKKYYNETNDVYETIKMIYHDIAKYDPTVNEHLFGYKIEADKISKIF